MIVAVDCGSTNMKAAAYSADGSRLARASRPFPYLKHTNVEVEISPDAVGGCFRGLMADLCQQAGRLPGEIRRIAFTSQAQTFTVVDPHGEPVGPFIGWADARAPRAAEELQELLGRDVHRQCGFAAIRPMVTVAKLVWWQSVHPWSDSMRVVFLPVYLAMQLGAEHATDRNLAAMSGLYSIPEGRWWTRALEATGVGAKQLGGLVECGQLLQKTGAPRWEEFADDVEVVMAGNDHTAAAVGCGCRVGRSTLTLGTAGVIYRHAGATPGPYMRAGLWGPYPLGGYYELLVLNHACSALDWADEALHGSVDSPRFAAASRRAEVTEDTPLFYPNDWGTPEAWVGQGTSDEKAYAVLEGIAFSLRKLGEKGFGAPGGTIVALGGGSALEDWVQLVANVFQRPLERTNADGLDGAAEIAGVPVQSRLSQSEIFEPMPEKFPLLEARYLRWKSSRRS